MLACIKTACAAIALTTGLAHAAVAQGASAGSAEADPDRIYLEADTVVEDRSADTVTARGEVRLRSGPRVLHAEEVVYDRASGRVTARGSVEIFEPGQPAQLADQIVLDGTMSEGVATGFATLLENNGRAAAASAVRSRDGSVTLTNAYYTACDLCEDEDPTWRLRARQVVRDTEDDMIYYRDARLEVLGAPILYAPIFAHPDPSAERKSGLLVPRIDLSDRLGFSYSQPYLFAISPYQDLAVGPRLMTQVNPAVEFDYRRRFYSGELSLKGSATYEQEFNDDGKFGEDEFRWHAFADGVFQISPEWRWGFGLQATSGDLYLRRYDYDERPEETGRLLEADNRQLISQVFVQGRGERFYADAAAARLQSLNVRVNDDTLPTIAPVAEARYRLAAPAALGRLSALASTAVLNREDGDDYARITVQGEWERPTILPGGVRLEPFALARADAYATEDEASGEENDFTRAMGLAGAEVSWPFARSEGWGDLILAPRVQAVAASGLDDDEIAPNEDSQASEINRTVLSQRVRAAGYDVWEDGARVDAGLTLAAEPRGPLGASAEAFIGRSWRVDGDAAFAESSGLAGDESDWVADVEVDLSGFSIAARGRFDDADGTLNRLDALARLDVWRLSGTVNYTNFDDASTARAVDEQINARLAYAVNKRWSLAYGVVRDLDTDTTRRTQIEAIYRDECTDLRLIYERDEFQIGDLGPSESLKLRLTLFTLGGVSED